MNVCVGQMPAWNKWWFSDIVAVWRSRAADAMSGVLRARREHVSRQPTFRFSRGASLAATLAALLAALALSGPAHAQTSVWSSTLTVKDISGNSIGCRTVAGLPAHNHPCADQLTDDDFSYGGTNYTITVVQFNTANGWLGIVFDTDISTASQDLTLGVGSSTFNLADGTVSTTSVTWANAGLSWSVDDSVSLSLTANTPASVTPPPDNDPPTLSSAKVNTATLTLNYNEALDTGSTPATTDFTVAVEDTNRTLSNVEVSGSAVTLTLSPAVISGQTVTVSYTAGTNPIRDLAQNNAATISSLAVTNSTGVDERAILSPAARQAETWYWIPDESDSLLISNLFHDPDGSPVQFDLSSTSTDVWICDTANGGDFAIEEVPDVPDRGVQFGSTVTFTGGDAAADCSVSNSADPTATLATDPTNPGVRGDGGNRVLTTRKIGPILEIKANSLADDTDGDGTVEDRGAGTYAATVFIRVWSGPSDPPLSSEAFASVNVLVKVGVNNQPQFAGGATGFAVTLMEGDDESDPMPSWVARDLDQGGNTNDTLTFGLTSTGGKSTSIAGGSISLKENTGDNPATSAIETDYVLSLSLVGRNLNYELGLTQFEIDLFVLDGWSEPVTVPIEVTLVDINEITLKTPIEDQKLINGLKRTIDLTTHFEDPEGDEITYEAYTNIHHDVVEVDNEADTLTIFGRHATKESDSNVFVTLIATDRKGLEANLVEFFVTTRHTNIPPSIDALASGTVSIGSGIFEAESAGQVLMPLIAYTDDEPAPTAVLTGGTLFRAVIDPNVMDGAICASGSEGCEKQSGMVAIVVGSSDLNFEETKLHTLSLSLQDAWQTELVSEALMIEVSVFDSNDAPTIVPGTTIPTQSVVVNGSTSFFAGDFFTDEDGDRLLIYAASGAESIATVEVSELDHVTFHGIREGEARITLTAVDPEGASVSRSLTLQVGPNNRPVVDEDVLAMRLPADNTLNIGATVDIELDGLFIDTDGGDSITNVTASSSDETVLLIAETDGGETATLIGRHAGTATLTIVATDQGGNTTSKLIEITVNAPPEESQRIEATTLVDRVTPLVLSLANVFADADDGANSLTITAETVGEGKERATVAVSGTELTITGTTGAEPGDVDIKLTAVDPHGAKATSSFMAKVVNLDPMVSTSVEAQELDRTAPLTIEVKGVFADSDGDIVLLTASVPEDSVVGVGNIELDDGLLELSALKVGDAIVTLEATDNDGGTVTSTFVATVNNLNPIVANPIEDQKTTRVEDLVFRLHETFEDPDTDEALVLAATIDDEMIASVSLADSVLTIEGLRVGNTTIVLSATDVDGGTFTHDFKLEVENVKPTVAMDVGKQTFDRRAPLGIDLSETFADDDGSVIEISADIADETVVEATVLDTTLTLSALKVGDTRITLTASDDNDAVITTDFDVSVINIEPVVTAPILDQVTTRVDQLVLDVRTNFDDPDADSDLLSITVQVDDDMYVEARINGTVLAINGLEVGMTNITLTATDEDGGTVSDTFTVNVENIDPFVAKSVPDQQMDRREPLVLDLSQTFEDADDGAPKITAMMQSGDIVSMSSIGDDSLLVLTALAVGETMITLTAMDANGASITDEFRVSVINIEPVVANPIPNQVTTRERDLSLDISGVFDDPDADNDMLSIGVDIEDPTIVDASFDGSSLTLRGLDVGSTTVTLTARDADQGMVQYPFIVLIENVAPQVVGSTSAFLLQVGGQPATQSITGLFIDDGDPLSFAVSSGNPGIASASIAGTTVILSPVSRGATMFTITASDPHGGVAAVSGSVSVGDGEIRAVAVKSLAAFGRAMLASVSSSVGARVMTNSRASDLALDTWAPIKAQNALTVPSTNDQSFAAWDVIRTTNAASTDAFSGPVEGFSALRSRLGKDFALNLGSSDNPSPWSVWGSLDRQSYDGAGYEGTATNAYLGADVTIGSRWTLGVAVSNNTGDADYEWGTATQTMDLNLSTAIPYVRFHPTEKTSLWGVFGFGSGELDTTVVGASNEISDLTSSLTMIGGTRTLRNAGRLAFSVRGDVASVSLETEVGDGAADDLVAEVNRARLGLEGSFQVEAGRNSTVEPFGQVSLRSDGGDGDSGTGFEVSAGVRLSGGPFSMEFQGRTLAIQQGDEYNESGFSMLATLNPSAGATGVTVTVAPQWGADAGGFGILWQDKLAPHRIHGDFVGLHNTNVNRSIETHVGYGILLANERYVLTPFVDLNVRNSDRRDILLGASLRQLVRERVDFEINLALGRVEEVTGSRSGQFGLNATLRF